MDTLCKHSGNETTLTHDQLQQVVYGIKKGKVPIKFAYLTELGSQGWGNIESERVQKGEYSMDSKLLESSLKIYLEELGNPEYIQLIDIGGGYGYTARSVLEILQRYVGVHYHTVDISPILIAHCQRNTSGTSISQSGHLLDLDDGGIAKKIREIKTERPALPILATIFGNTIGNFNSPHDIIRQVTEGLDSNDRLVVGVHLFKKGYEEAVLREYETNQDIHTILSSTFRIFDIDPNGIRTYTEWDEKYSSVRGYIELKQRTTISSNPGTIVLPEGYAAEVLRSTKYSLQSLLNLPCDNRLAQLKTDIRGLYSQVMIAPNCIL